MTKHSEETQTLHLKVFVVFPYLHSSTVTIQLPLHAGMHVHPGMSSPGTEPRRFVTWTHRPGSCPGDTHTHRNVNRDASPHRHHHLSWRWCYLGKFWLREPRLAHLWRLAHGDVTLRQRPLGEGLGDPILADLTVQHVRADPLASTAAGFTFHSSTAFHDKHALLVQINY